MSKQRLEIRIDEDTRAGLEIEARHTGKSLSVIAEQYIVDGLARAQGKVIEVESLPEVRAAVREETGKVMAQLYEKLSADLAAQNRRGDERLAALIVKAVRFSGLCQRMLYMFIRQQTSERDANRIYEVAKEQTGKDLTRSTANE